MEKEIKKIGLVLITHGDFGKSLLATAKTIVGECEQCVVVGIGKTEGMAEVMTEVEAALQEVDSGRGVLVCTDMLGGTPSNISLSFLSLYKIEVVCGVNLPMLLSVLSKCADAELELSQLASEARKSGQDGIVIAGEILRRKVDK